MNKNLNNKKMTVEEILDLFAEVVKITVQSPNDEVCGRKTRELLLNFGIHKWCNENEQSQKKSKGQELQQMLDRAIKIVDENLNYKDLANAIALQLKNITESIIINHF